ncbi:MAG: hypothetical protein ACJ74O_19120 [Frankiaceae bacterium]
MPRRRPGRPPDRRRPTAARHDTGRVRATAPQPPPPRTFGPHFASALRELFLQTVAGWRLVALGVAIVIGVFGGASIAGALGIDGNWGIVGVQALVVLLVVLVIAVLVAVGRLRNARRL